MSRPEPVQFLGRREGGAVVPTVPRMPSGPRAAHGTDKEVEDDDPFELVGVRFQLPPGVDGDRELARCFVEEYALLGWPADRIRTLFTDPEYAGAHAVAQRRGLALVDEVIAATFGEPYPRSEP